MKKLRKYIVVEGNIGSGKTSLVNKLAADLGGQSVLEEFAENAFLAQFYENPSKYAFPLELSFLAARYKQMLYSFENQNSDLIISDYHFRKSFLFASVNLPAAEFNLYKSFYEIMEIKIPEPDVIIFLKKDIPALKSNITKRGRIYENAISEKYLEQINDAYRMLTEKYPQNNLIEFDSNFMDFVQNNHDYQLIFNALKGKL